MASSRAPKQWPLTKNETITSFENWRQNLVYILSLDKNFAPFLTENAAWAKKSANNPTRDFPNDGDDVALEDRKTGVQKALLLDMMLGQVANFCPVISRNSIVKTSTSLKDVWQKIRQHYGFQSSGSHFLDLASIRLEQDEKPEDLYQRLCAFFEDNLLTRDGGILHHGEVTTADEELTPSMENMIVLLWLQLISPNLPQLVKQKYGADLRNKSLASIKPEISQSLNSLMEELRSMEDSKILRAATSSSKFTHSLKRKSFKFCVLCKTAGRPTFSSHTLLECRFLPEHDRKMFGKSRYIQEQQESDTESEEQQFACQDIDVHTHDDSALLDTQPARRVKVVQSPYLYVHYKHHSIRLTIDTGATTNMIRASFAKHIGIPIKPADQMAHQADGITPLDVIGEVHVQFHRENWTCQLDALVVEQLDVDVLAGNPFLVVNDIATRPAKRQIVIAGKDIMYYGPQVHQGASVRRTQAFVLRGPSQESVVLPGQYIEVSTPPDADPDELWALEPRFDAPSSKGIKPERAWPPPQAVHSVAHKLRITNTSEEPVLLRRYEHFCQVHAVTSPATTAEQTQPYNGDIGQCSTLPKSNSDLVSIDPDTHLDEETREKFREIHHQFDEVFSPKISKYNGASGQIEGVVNMGPTLPPQRKGRIPQYSREKLVELQSKFDELEAAGVFAKPEKIPVTVEYLNLSFLVKKSNGGNRLVTAFGEVGQYSKPQPSLMPNVETTLRQIACWKYIIATDLLQSFYQIPLSKDSMKFCGITTPFKGIRVYTRCAMGMPGSETVLEELMSRVLGDLIQEGHVAKVADDLYCGGNTVDELMKNWYCVLEALQRNNLRLSAIKTVICPQTTNILGWIWSNGTLRASPHKVSALSSVDPPKTVQALRSFVGAYKVLSRVLKGYAQLLQPFEQVTAGRQSHEKIQWNEHLMHAFQHAQQALKESKVITLPRPDDSIWIVTDGSVKNCGIGATYYVSRDSKLFLAGFFNAKLRKNQVTWLPCEVEALCISAAVKHYAPYITQATKPVNLLTDSRPCVLAYRKLCRGEFSNSSRVTTFLSTVSRYNVHVGHIAGASNLPSDYTSRNPATCKDGTCQVCKFVAESEDSTVYNVSVKDITDGAVRMPFTNRAAWLATQMECPDLRRVHSHLQQGTRPTKKLTNIPDVKRYLQRVIIASDGLLIVRNCFPFRTVTDRIVVPRAVVSGLLTAIHIRFGHPSAYQMKQLMDRYFFALGIEQAIHSVVAACQQCSALKSLPNNLHIQTTSTPPECIGTSFAADVMRRYRQCIIVLRETITAYTSTRIIASEKHGDLREALIILCAEVRNLGEAGCSVRIDCAPGLSVLTNDKILENHGISVEMGCVKNPNKNPVAERAIEELGRELLNIVPEGGPISPSTLAIATSNMNMRIRRGGLSSRELWTQRDQITGKQLPVDDRKVICDQLLSRCSNHSASAHSKARSEIPPLIPHLQVGDLVFLHRDRDKTKARDKYMVTEILDEWCKIRKFVKSQFRSKTYDVLVADCYPVTPTTLSGPSETPGLDKRSTAESMSDSDNEPTSPQHIPNNERLASSVESDYHSQEDPPQDSLVPMDSNITPSEVVSSGSPETIPPMILTDPPASSNFRRSSRKNKGAPPKRFHDEYA